MNEEEMDLQWRFEAFRAALQIEIETGEVDMKNLWVRAKGIYIDGLKENILGWKLDKTKEPKNVTPKKEEAKPRKAQTKVIDGVESKICPLCNEPMRKGWTTHLFKKDGTKCGYTGE